MTRTLRTDWAIIRSSDNAVVHTFGEKDMAISWFEEHDGWFEEHDGWSKGLEVVRLRLTKEPVWVPAPRHERADPFAIPAMVGVRA